MAAKRIGRVELVPRKSVTHPWGYRVRSSNGQITEPSSQGYTRGHALRAALATAQRLGIPLLEPGIKAKSRWIWAPLTIAFVVVVCLLGVGTDAAAGRIDTIALDSSDQICNGTTRTYTWTSPWVNTVYIHRAVSAVFIGGNLIAQAEAALTVWGPQGFIAFESLSQFGPSNAPSQTQWDYGKDAIPLRLGERVTLQYGCTPLSPPLIVVRALFYAWVYDAP